MRQFVTRTIRPIAHRWGFDLIRVRDHHELEAFRYSARHAVDIMGMAIRQLIGERGTARFIQIGANDGLRDDDFRRFIEGYELSGLMIEPQAQAFQRLSKRYSGNSRLILENCAIAPHTGSLKLYAFREGGEGERQTDQFTSFDRTILEQVQRNGGIRSEILQIEVPAYSLGDLLAKHSLPNPDIIVIDTEGYDYKIIKSLDLASLRPALIQMEYINLPDDEKRQALEYLVRHGYRLGIQQGEIVALASGRVEDAPTADP